MEFLCVCVCVCVSFNALNVSSHCLITYNIAAEKSAENLTVAQSLFSYCFQDSLFVFNFHQFDCVCGLNLLGIC